MKKETIKSGEIRRARFFSIRLVDSPMTIMGNGEGILYNANGSETDAENDTFPKEDLLRLKTMLEKTLA